MPSLRQLSSCIGLSGDVSIIADFFGFFRGRLPPDPTGAPVSISLARQMRLLQGPHFHLNLVSVGVENFTDNENIEIDYAVFKIRNIYAQVGVGVGRVLNFAVTVADAHGLDAPTTTGQLEDISNRWVVPGNGIDVFVPFAMNVPSDGGMILGQSPQPGPCEGKNAKGMNASVVGLFGSEQTARSFSHEVGHYLGLGHQNDHPENLMCQSSKASSIRNSVNLTSDQGNTVKGHCLVKPGC